jgi:hypothetical protein
MAGAVSKLAPRPKVVRRVMVFFMVILLLFTQSLGHWHWFVQSASSV